MSVNNDVPMVGIRHRVMKLRFIVIAASFAISILTVSTPSQAQQSCAALFDVAAQASQEAVPTRAELVAILRENPDVPVFLKKTGVGDIPVILVTAKTFPSIEPLLEKSMGTQIVQQVGYRNDHGLMRVASHIIDVDSPGRRGFGEINETGIAWKDIGAYLKRRFLSEANQYNIIEVGYWLTPKELEIAKYYQTVRRAAIIRVPFTFGQAQNDLNQPNMLRAGEHCFVFCKGTAISSHIHEIKEKMKELGIENPDQFIQRDEVRKFLDAATDLLVEEADMGANWVSWTTVNSKAIAKSLDAVLPQQLDRTAKGSLINWIVGLDASMRYHELSRRLGISGDNGFGDMNSSRATFILMYAKTTDAPLFENATFESAGVFSNWTNENQVPLGAEAQ